MRAQRKAVALYNAPIVKERYKRVASHFNKPKNSQGVARLGQNQAQHLARIQPMSVAAKPTGNL